MYFCSGSALLTSYKRTEVARSKLQDASGLKPGGMSSVDCRGGKTNSGVSATNGSPQSPAQLNEKGQRIPGYFHSFWKET